MSIIEQQINTIRNEIEERIHSRDMDADEAAADLL